LSEEDLEKLTQKLYFRVGYEVGYACPDIQDLVQETIRRYLDAAQADRLRTPGAVFAFINGICRNVISEYRRRLHRDAPMPEVIPEPKARGLTAAEQFDLRQAVEEAMAQLSPRDRLVLRAFYIEEQPVEEILLRSGLTLENFRVVLCRAKERFRQIYRQSLQYRAASGH
jgi:RNA polymerase sigma-70 factor (ECF subfamily)